MGQSIIGVRPIFRTEGNWTAMQRRDVLSGFTFTLIAGLARPVLAQEGRVIVSKIALLDGRVVMPVTIRAPRLHQRARASQHHSHTRTQ